MLDRFQRLLESVVTAGEQFDQLADRRRFVLQTLADLTGATSWMWSWGYGTPREDSISPMIQIDGGFSDDQRRALIEWGLQREANQVYRNRVLALMQDRCQQTSLRRDLYTEEEWVPSFPPRQFFNRCGWTDWLHSIRYSTTNNWSTMSALRGEGNFTLADRDLVHTAMAGIQWLHAMVEERVSPELFVSLTPRQRAVMMFVLDGRSRKEIATSLQITENTVGDHLKRIFEHFGVHSAIELAAKFLRNQ